MKNKFDMFEKLKNIKNKKMVYLVVCLCLVVVIYVFLVFRENRTAEEIYIAEDSLYLSYVRETENRLSKVLESVKGLENVKIFLNVTQSPKITYLSEEKITSNNESSKVEANTIILSKDGTKTYPIVVLEELPKIEGVLIVAKGAGSVKTKLELCNIVSSILGVEVSAVEVLEGK